MALGLGNKNPQKRVFAFLEPGVLISQQVISLGPAGIKYQRLALQVTICAKITASKTPQGDLCEPRSD
jgi:hypothetical protein